MGDIMVYNGDKLSKETVENTRKICSSNSYCSRNYSGITLLNTRNDRQKRPDINLLEHTFSDEEKKIDKLVFNHISYIGDEPPANKIREEFTPRLQDLSDYIGSDIVFCTCHSNRKNVPQQVDDRMHIFSMMAPAWVGYERKKVDSFTINDVTIMLPPGQRDYIEPLSDEIPGCDGIYDDYGYLMALMVGYNIYILNDCLHSKNPNELKASITIFEYIINQAVRLWKECEEN